MNGDVYCSCSAPVPPFYLGVVYCFVWRWLWDFQLCTWCHDKMRLSGYISWKWAGNFECKWKKSEYPQKIIILLLLLFSNIYLPLIIGKVYFPDTLTLDQFMWLFLTNGIWVHVIYAVYEQKLQMWLPLVLSLCHENDISWGGVPPLSEVIKSKDRQSWVELQHPHLSPGADRHVSEK